MSSKPGIVELEKLKQLTLPAGWKTAQLQVEIVKSDPEYPYKKYSIIYDSLNDCFYFKLPSEFIYQEADKTVMQGIHILREANKIIKK